MNPNRKKKIFRDLPENRGISLGDEAVLPEVRRRLAQIKLVDVIIGAQKGKNADRVREYLKTLGIKLRPGGTEYYFFATITAKQADQIDHENDKTNKDRMIDKVWLDKVMKAMVEKSQVTINAPAACRFSERAEKIFIGPYWIQESLLGTNG